MIPSVELKELVASLPSLKVLEVKPGKYKNHSLSPLEPFLFDGEIIYHTGRSSLRNNFAFLFVANTNTTFD